jgi:hypothetical protein
VVRSVSQGPEVSMWHAMFAEQIPLAEKILRTVKRPAAAPLARYKIAMGLTGEPVPRGSRSGAITVRKDHRPAASQSDSRSSNWR